MRPEQVLDMQGDLLDRLGTPLFVKMVHGTLEQAYQPGSEHGATPDQTMGALMSALPKHVEAAYAYRVTPDMSLLVQHAADSLDETDRADSSLAPTGCGIVRFDRPLPIVDARGSLMLAHWLTWGPIRVNEGGIARSAMFCTWWNDMDEPDATAAEIMADPELHHLVRPVAGRWSLIGGEFILTGRPLGGPTVALTPKQRADILADGDRPVESGYTNPSRYVHALWLLLGQSVTTVEDEYVRKTSRRLAQQRGLPARVSVIRLRRTEGSRRENESVVEWAHRWVVRGHWRWQPYGPGRSERRRIWIAPYVKGPDDKPLVVTDKVYDLRR